jgi:hypothetical protein
VRPRPLARLTVSVLLLAAISFALTTNGLASPRAACGVERWAVKTLSDPAAATVNFHAVPTTVDALRTRALPQTSSGTPRTPPVETHTYRVTATLIEARLEADHDIHLVIAQPGHRTHRMIVELPDPNCPGVTSSIRRARIAKARAAFVKACGMPAASPQPLLRLHGTATITGVGFVDVEHSRPQAGVAPNDIELHPVLGFVTARCRAS